MAEQRGLSERMIFLRSISDVQKVHLLRRCTALVYTPTGEHFGIVPIEAMYARRPVIAVNDGGPCETVVSRPEGRCVRVRAGRAARPRPTIRSRRTGWLCDPTPEAFADAMAAVAEDERLAEQVGICGRKRVLERFSFRAFTARLDAIVRHHAVRAPPSQLPSALDSGNTSADEMAFE